MRRGEAAPVDPAIGAALEWVSMTPSRRAGWLLAALVLTLPLQARETSFAEPYGDHPYWLTPACEMASDPVRRELHPVRAGQVAETTYQFGTVAADGRLRLRYRVRLTRPGDQVLWSVSWDNERFAPAASQTWRQGEQILDLTRYIAADHPLYVKLSLLAAARPQDVAVGELTWLLDGVERRPPTTLRLPRGLWVAPAWAAAAEGRRLATLPAGERIETGDGRVSTALRGRRAADLWLADAVGGPLFGAGRTRLVRAATGDWGGSLWFGETPCAQHGLAGLSVGGALPVGLVTRGSPEALAARGLPAGETVDWIETGPLELRLLDLALTWSPAGCLAAGELCIVNHGDQPRHAQVTLGVAGPGMFTAPRRMGCEVPPGPWLLPVRLLFSDPRRWPVDGAVYQLTASIDDGQAISDQLQRTLALADPPEMPLHDRLTEALAAGGGWVTHLPVPRADLELAAARRVPVVLRCDDPAQAAAARLEYALRPPVVAVVGP